MSRVQDKQPLNFNVPRSDARVESNTRPLPRAHTVVVVQEIHREHSEPWYTRSIPFFTIFGIDVRISPLLVMYIILVAVINACFGWWYLALSLATSVVLFFTVLVHELGHCAAARLVGGSVSHILLWPLGGLAFIATDDASAMGDMFVAIAGPLTHVPMFALWLLFLKLSSGSMDLTASQRGDFWAALCLEGCWIQVYLFAFNLLLPAYPLDSSRVLVAALACCKVPIDAAAITVIVVSTIMSCALIVYGFWVLQFLAVFIGGWCLGETWKVFALKSANQLGQHPTFSKYERQIGTA